VPAAALASLLVTDGLAQVTTGHNSEANAAAAVAPAAAGQAAAAAACAEFGTLQHPQQQTLAVNEQDLQAAAATPATAAAQYDQDMLDDATDRARQ